MTMTAPHLKHRYKLIDALPKFNPWGTTQLLEGRHIDDADDILIRFRKYTPMQVMPEYVNFCHHGIADRMTMTDQTDIFSYFAITADDKVITRIVIYIDGQFVENKENWLFHYYNLNSKLKYVIHAHEQGLPLPYELEQTTDDDMQHCHWIEEHRNYFFRSNSEYEEFINDCN